MRKTVVVYFLVAIVATMFIGSGTEVVQAAGKIVHDAEYYVLDAQNGEKWAAEDKRSTKNCRSCRKSGSFFRLEPNHDFPPFKGGWEGKEDKSEKSDKGLD